jgi:hypothetical protein
VSLLDIVRAGVAVANKVTAPLQAAVAWEAYTGEDGRGARTYAASRNVPALVEMKQQLVKTAEGDMTPSRASITFLDPTILLTNQDRITLPDGTTGPIIERMGLVDAKTGRPVMTQIFIG